jgi:hypothetical protein
MLITKHPRLVTLAISTLICTVTFFIYISSPGRQTDLDTRWSIHVADSLVREGNLDLDEYRALIPANDYRIQIYDGHLYNFYPIGVSVLAVPVVYLYHLVEPAKTVEQFYVSVEIGLASFVMALTAVIVYLTARLSLNIRRSLLCVFIFVVCTPAWSTASRALWQHGPAMLMLSLALYLMLLARQRPALAQFAGLPLAFSYVIRPINSLSIVVLTLYVLLEYRQYFLRYVFWAMWIIGPFVLLNLAVFHALLPGYYTLYQIFSTGTLAEALIGNLLGPSRGLLIFSPVFIFAIMGMALKLKRRSWSRLDFALFSIIILHWIAISIWPIWWGGWSFGPRLFSEMIPYLMFFLISAVPFMTVARRRLIPVQGTFIALVGLSLFIHYRGATDVSTFDWNSQPVNVDTTLTRLWDWQDLMFLRNLHGLDPLVPTKISVAPESLLVRHDPRSGQIEQVQLEIYDMHYRNFNWTADVPTGVRIASNNTGHGEKKYTLSVKFDAAGYSAGWHQLSITITARRGNGSLSGTGTLSVPVTVYIGRLDKVFLPGVMNTAR